MSNRSLLEFNHDYPKQFDDADLLKWAQQITAYLRTGQKSELPYGVELVHSRHHADKCPAQEYLKGNK